MHISMSDRRSPHLPCAGAIANTWRRCSSRCSHQREVRPHMLGSTDWLWSSGYAFVRGVAGRRSSKGAAWMGVDYVVLLPCAVKDAIPVERLVTLVKHRNQ